MSPLITECTKELFLFFFNSAQNEDTKVELSDWKEKYEKAEQEKQALSEELEDCKANMRDLTERGTKVSAVRAVQSCTEESCFLFNKIIINQL